MPLPLWTGLPKIGQDTWNALVTFVNGLETSLGSKVNSSTYTTGLAAKVDTTDGRLADQRTPLDGSVTLTKLSASGTKSATTILYGDNTWKTAPTGGGTSTPASTTAAGIARLSTTSEAVAGTAVDIAVTPAALAAATAGKQTAYYQYASVSAAQAALTNGTLPDGADVLIVP